MSEWVKVKYPFPIDKTREDIVNLIKEQLLYGKIRVIDEEHTFTSGVYSYQLDHFPYEVSSDSIEVSGTLNSNRHVFVFGRDYNIVGQNIVFDSNYDYPDNNTKFYVSYYYLGTKSGLTSEEPSSTTMIMIESVANALYDLYEEIKNSYYMTMISTATGSSLDSLATLVGCIRSPGAKAVGTERFYFSTTPVTIDTGTIVATQSSATQEQLLFETTSGGTYTTGSYVDIQIRAKEYGSKYNVGLNTVTVLLSPITNVSSVTNITRLRDGEDEESDEDFRRRIPLAVESKGKSTLNALKYDIEQISGVRSVKIMDRYRGNGTVDIFITPKTFPVSTNLSTIISNAIDSGKALGIDVGYVIPYVKNVWITGSGIRKYDSDAVNVFNTASGEIWDYFYNLEVGQRTRRNQLFGRMLDDNNLIDITNFYIREYDADLIVQQDVIMKIGYRVNDTGVQAVRDDIDMFDCAEIIQCTGDYSTGWYVELGRDTYDSGLSIIAFDVYDVFEVEQDGTKFTEGVDWEFTGLDEGDETINGKHFKQLHWLTGATNYPVNGSYYSVKYVYDAIKFDVSSTGEY